MSYACAERFRADNLARRSRDAQAVKLRRLPHLRRRSAPGSTNGARDFSRGRWISSSRTRRSATCSILPSCPRTVEAFSGGRSTSWAYGRCVIPRPATYLWDRARWQRQAAPLRAIQNGWAHSDQRTTPIYADYAPDLTQGAMWAEPARSRRRRPGTSESAQPMMSGLVTRRLQVQILPSRPRKGPGGLWFRREGTGRKLLPNFCPRASIWSY